MQTPITKMYNYVLGWTILLAAFAVTTPIAMLRVSQTQKFVGQPFNSQTCESSTPKTRAIVSWIDHCLPMTKPPLPQKK